jgi:hypothetical protein
MGRWRIKKSPAPRAPERASQGNRFGISSLSHVRARGSAVFTGSYYAKPSWLVIYPDPIGTLDSAGGAIALPKAGTQLRFFDSQLTKKPILLPGTPQNKQAITRVSLRPRSDPENLPSHKYNPL